MTLQDFHLFLVPWGAWNRAILEKLDYSGPGYCKDYIPTGFDEDYMDEPQTHYAESEFEHANTRLKFVDAENRAIIKGIYLDCREGYFDRKYGEEGISRALRVFLTEFETTV